MAPFKLVIANKTYSSWSLRAWIALKHTGAAFEETMVHLDKPDTKEKILAVSPAGRVPVLVHGETVIWDSLAIIEYLAETFPAAKLWPEAKEARAHARSLAAEMHSGFAALRSAMPMNLRKALHGRGRTPGSLEDIHRVVDLFREARARYGAGGPYLFGSFTGADAMYAPVVTRLHTYGVKLEGVPKEYVAAMLAHPALVEWTKAAQAEDEVVPSDEYPAHDY